MNDNSQPNNDLATLEAELVGRVAAAADEAGLEAVRIAALGKQGSISALLKTLGAMTPDERKAKGPLINGLRDRVQGAIAERKAALGDAALDALAGAFNQMVEELSLTRERIDYLQRLAGWQDVARRLAHEIKNPLTPIQLAVQEVARKYNGDDARFKRTLDTAREVVEEEVATLRRLVTAFSEFARLPEVKTAAGDLAEFVRDMATAKAFIDEAAGADGKVRVEFDAGDAPIPVRLDRIMLRRAFENLVRNAAQAIGARGGTVTVRAEKRRVTVPGADGAPTEEVDQAWLVVEDDGPGIPPEHRAKVFDPYFTTKSDGTGLGLAIVRKIAIDHAGDVGLEARPGGGARFILTLPLHDPSRRPRRSFVTFTRNT